MLSILLLLLLVVSSPPKPTNPNPIPIPQSILTPDQSLQTSDPNRPHVSGLFGKSLIDEKDGAGGVGGEYGDWALLGFISVVILVGECRSVSTLSAHVILHVSRRVSHL